MALVDAFRQGVSNAVSAGSAAARGQGAALKSDFEVLVKPQLDDIIVQIASITEDYVSRSISKEQAQDDLSTQCNRIKPIILAVAELALLAIQTIINAVLNALREAVNAAAGIALF